MQSRPDDSVILFQKDQTVDDRPSLRRDHIETKSGRQFDVRAARPLDMPALRLFLSRITADDLRFRFLSPVRDVSDGLIRQLLGYDHATAEHFLAFEPGGAEIIASAVVALGSDGQAAEVAICTRPDFKHLGLSWSLLDHATAWAARHGACELLTLEAIDHADAIRLEQEQGFKIDPRQTNSGMLRLSRRLKPASKGLQR
jgi:acetyltransferase